MSIFSALAKLAITSVKSLNHGALIAEVLTEIAIHAGGVPVGVDKHGKLIESDTSPLGELEKRVAKLEKQLKKAKTTS